MSGEEDAEKLTRSEEMYCKGSKNKCVVPENSPDIPRCSVCNQVVFMHDDGTACDHYEPEEDFKGSLPDARATKFVLDNVSDERARQDKKWGEQNHPDGTGKHSPLADTFRELCDAATADGTLTWAHILLEEVAEALDESDPEKLEEELLQTIAVGVAWVEAIRRRQND